MKNGFGRKESRSCINAVAWGFVALVMMGCGGSDHPPTAEATGTVTHQGQPLADMNVIFSPAEKGPAGIGTTDASGKFSLTTFKRDDGAYLGKHKVTIVAMDGDTEGDGGPLQKYAVSETSPLTVEVTSSGPNEFTFDLTD